MTKNNDKNSSENKDSSEKNDSSEKSDNTILEVVGKEDNPELSKELKIFEQQNIAKLGEFVQSAQTYENYLIKRTRTRARRSAIQFFLVVVMTTLAATYYYAFVASSRYTSTFQFTIETSRQSSTTMLQGIMGQVSGHSTDKDTNVLSEYLRSPVLLDNLDQWLGVKEHYQQESIDPISRLSENATREEFLEYYRGFLEIDTKTTPNVVSVSVQAFDPDFAAAMGQSMITLSEELINSINEKIVLDSLKMSKEEVRKAENRLNEAHKKAEDFQVSEVDIDPLKSVESISGIIALLEQQIAISQSQLTEFLSYMQPDSIQVISLKQRIASLEKQIDRERAKIINPEAEGKRNYPEKLSSFSRLKMQVEFARQSYEASLASYEIAKSEAMKKVSYVVAFVPASLPDGPSEPQRFISILTVFIFVSCGYMLVSFLLATIRDHIDT